MTEADHEYQRRMPHMVPGQLKYSAKMNLAALEKFYCWNCMCPVKGAMARRTYVDVYSTGVQTNTPKGCCCCFWCDNAVYLHYDDKRVGDTWGQAGCCKPFPWCCPHLCNCCGETLYVNQCFACCAPGYPLFAGHCFGCLGYIIFAYGKIYPCCVMAKYDTWYGLEPGEATKVAAEIELAKREGPGTVAARAAIGIAQVMPMGPGPQGQEMSEKK